MTLGLSYLEFIPPGKALYLLRSFSSQQKTTDNNDQVLTVSQPLLAGYFVRETSYNLEKIGGYL